MSKMKSDTGREGGLPVNKEVKRRGGAGRAPDRWGMEGPSWGPTGASRCLAHQERERSQFPLAVCVGGRVDGWMDG